MIPIPTILLETGIGLTGNITDLPQQREWGVMIGCLIFCGLTLVVIIAGVTAFIKFLLRLYDKSIESNKQLALSIDNLSDSTTAFREDVTNKIDAVQGGIEKINNTLDEHGKIIDKHTDQLDDLNTKVNKHNKHKNKESENE